MGTEPTPDVIDVAGLLANLGDDRELAVQLLTQLGTDLDSRAEQLRRTLEEGEPDAVHQLAHALKGALSSACANDARERVRQLDDAARQGDLAGARAVWPDADAALLRLHEALSDPRALVGPE